MKIRLAILQTQEKLVDKLDRIVEKAKQNPLAENGEIGRGRSKDNSFDNVKAINLGGNSQDYLVRRLARDNPGVSTTTKKTAVHTASTAPKLTCRD